MHNIYFWHIMCKKIHKTSPRTTSVWFLYYSLSPIVSRQTLDIFFLNHECEPFSNINRVMILLIFFFPLLKYFTKQYKVPLPLMADLMLQTLKSVLEKAGQKISKNLITIQLLVQLSLYFHKMSYNSMDQLHTKC